MTLYLNTIISNLEQAESFNSSNPLQEISDLLSPGGLVEEALTQAEASLRYQGIKKLQRQDGEQFNQQVNREIRKIWCRIAEMKRLNCSPQEICRTAATALKQLNESSAAFFKDKKDYEFKKGKISEKFDCLEEKIKTFSLDFDEFRMPVKAEKKKITVKGLLNEDPHFMKKSGSQPGKQKKLDEEGKPSQDERTYSKSLMIGKISQSVERQYGKIPGTLCKFTLNMTGSSFKEETFNPKRDLTLSVTSHIGMSFALSAINPSSIPTYMLMTGMYAIGDWAKHTEAGLSPDIRTSFPAKIVTRSIVMH